MITGKPRRAVRPLLCAWCGERVLLDESLRIEQLKLPGKPRAGWHTRCVLQDALTKQLAATDWEPIFAKIEQRDPARVLRRIK